MAPLYGSFLLAFAIAAIPSLVWSQASPSDINPTSYHLKIDASDLTTSDTFSGAVTMNMTVVTTVSSLVVNADNLVLNETSLVMMKKAMFASRWDFQRVSSVSHSESLLNIYFPSPLAPGDYSFFIEYLGYYQNTTAGFAKVGYQFRNETRYLGVTGLEPTNARKVFPCLDVPGPRVKFTLELTVNRPHWAISSVKPSAIHNVSDTTKRVFLFNNYPQIPVNRLDWAVVDPTSYGVHEDNSTSTMIHSRAPYLYVNQTFWANQLTASLVQAVENYTAVSFDATSPGSSKIEQVVLPDFFVETSEGYGFMTFSEESLLVSPDKSSTRYIQGVGLGLAKQVVQQWFGVMVSVDSWNNIWLLKGLDEFLQYIIADSLSEMSGWEISDQAVVELTQRALAEDSPDSHALMVTSDSQSTLVTTVYDNLTKLKGGALMRMLNDIFGTIFKDALSIYIQNSYSSISYNPTTPSIFFNMLYGIAADANIDLAQNSLETVMEEWINAPGYPVLSVTSNTTHFNISQSNSSQWWVPVTYSLQGSTNVIRMWLQPGGYFTVQASSSKWILLNINQTGYYRVNYTAELWQALSNQLSTDLTQLPRLSRAQLLDDMFAMNAQKALPFSSFLRAETDYFAWTTALRHYEALIYSVAGHSSYQLLQNYVLDLMNGVISEIGFSSKAQDTHIDKLKRSLVLEKACQFGHQTCIQKAVSNLRSWMAQTFYDPDLSPALLCAGVANSTTEVWHSVLSMYTYSVFPSVRLALLKSLTCTHNQDLLFQFLNQMTSVSDREVGDKDKTVLLQTLASTPFGANILLNWLVDRLQAQANSTTGPSTPAPGATTSQPQTTLAPNASNTPTPDQTTSQPMRQAAIPTEKLPETDVTTILNLILPMLTTLEQGTKLDSFLTVEKTGLSNSTLEAMKSATKKIYMQADQVMKLNVKLTTWLEAEAAAATSSGEPTKPSTQTQRPQTTPTPSGAAPVAPTLLACLVLCLYIINMV